MRTEFRKSSIIELTSICIPESYLFMTPSTTALASGGEKNRALMNMRWASAFLPFCFNSAPLARKPLQGMIQQVEQNGLKLGWDGLVWYPGMLCLLSLFVGLPSEGQGSWTKHMAI